MEVQLVLPAYRITSQTDQKTHF